MSGITALNQGLPATQGTIGYSIDNQLVLINNSTVKPPQYALIDHTSKTYNLTGFSHNRTPISEAVKQQIIEAVYSRIDGHGELQLRNFSVQDLSVDDLLTFYQILASYHQDPFAFGRKVVLAHLSLIETRLKELVANPDVKKEVKERIEQSNDAHVKALKFRFFSMSVASEATLTAFSGKTVGEDVLISIFKLLDPKDHASLKLVCKHWNLVLNSPLFLGSCVDRIQKIAFYGSARISGVLVSPKLSAQARIEIAYGEFAKELKTFNIPRREEHPLNLSAIELQDDAELLEAEALIVFCNSLPPAVIPAFPANLPAFERAIQTRNLFENSAEVRNVEELYLGAHELSVLPKEIKFFTGLTTIYIGGNSLSALPEEITSLPRLEVLVLSINNLDFLPEGMSKMTNLGLLYVKNNNLTSLPKGFTRLTKLEMADFRGNPLSEEAIAMIRQMNIREVGL